MACLTNPRLQKGPGRRGRSGDLQRRQAVGEGPRAGLSWERRDLWWNRLAKNPLNRALRIGQADPGRLGGHFRDIPRSRKGDGHMVPTLAMIQHFPFPGCRAEPQRPGPPPQGVESSAPFRCAPPKVSSRGGRGGPALGRAQDPSCWRWLWKGHQPHPAWKRRLQRQRSAGDMPSGGRQAFAGRAHHAGRRRRGGGPGPGPLWPAENELPRGKLRGYRRESTPFRRKRRGIRPATK